MAQPNRASNLLQTVLIMALVFLAMQMLMPQRPTTFEYMGKRISTKDEAFASLQDANRNIYDQTGARLQTFYNTLVDKEVAEKRMTPEAADSAKRHSAVLLADTQLKAGIVREDTGRMRNAYHTMVGLHNSLQGKPEADQPYAVHDVTGDSRFGWHEWSVNQLYNASVDHISGRARHDKVWGIIPGGYALLDWLVNLTGARPDFSYAFAAFILALIVRSIIFPLAQRQLMFGRQMSQLTPLIGDIRKKYGDDPPVQQRKIMELYREYGINPAAGCLPAVVQIPLFITVYQAMLLYQFEFTKGTFLWVNPATSAAMPHGFVAPNLGQLDPTLIVIYGIMMIVSTMLTPVSDPTQVKQQRLMGIGISIFFTVTMFFGWFPVPGAFVLYWIFLLVLSTLQAFRAYRLPLPPLQKKIYAGTGGAIPASGFGGKWAARIQEMMEQQQIQAQQPGAPRNGKTPIIGTGEIKTGTPAKHKPKKKK